jgi:hypothetical protein
VPASKFDRGSPLYTLVRRSHFRVEEVPVEQLHDRETARAVTTALELDGARLQVEATCLNLAVTVSPCDCVVRHLSSRLARDVHGGIRNAPRAAAEIYAFGSRGSPQGVSEHARMDESVRSNTLRRKVEALSEIGRE